MASETKNPQRLALVRGVHTFIYIVMATSTLLLVYAGLTGDQGWWLWVVGAPSCRDRRVRGQRDEVPHLTLAVSYGAEKGYAFDTFLPERATRHVPILRLADVGGSGPARAPVVGTDRMKSFREPLRTSRSGRNIRHGWNTRHARHCITLAPGVMSQRPSVPPGPVVPLTSFS